MKEVQLFCPATIANISCGFDVLGLCLDSIGDTMTIKKSFEKGIRITKISGADLPLETEKNVAGVAALALLEVAKLDCGFDIEIVKKIKTSSGIGSSAASAAGAVFGINLLLGEPFSKTDLVGFAMQGEKLASGTAHPDNVAPALFGGITLIRECFPLDVVSINVPSSLWATIVHPKIQINTSDARALLKNTVSLDKAVQQWANLGAFICALQNEDYPLMSRSLIDVVVEPERSVLIPHFSKAKQAAEDAGALGSGISGSGLSIYALSEGQDTAQKVADAFDCIYKTSELDFDIHISKINTEGVKAIYSN